MKKTVFIPVSILFVALCISEKTHQTVESAEPSQGSVGHENYDIRLDKIEKVATASDDGSIHAAIERLKERVPNVKVDRHSVFERHGFL